MKLNRLMALMVMALVIGTMGAGLSAAPATQPAAPPAFKSIKDSIRPAVKNGGFAMDGYFLWCSSVVKVGDTYHLFASRWPGEKPADLGRWTSQSECVRATSKDLLGPYTFQEVVLQKRPDQWDNTRVHNVKILRMSNVPGAAFGGDKAAAIGAAGPNDKFVIFYTDSANECGYAESDSVTGPWTRSEKVVVPAANPAPLIMPDRSMYVFCRFGTKAENRQIDMARAFRAATYKGPYTRVPGPDNLLPGSNELEDPTIWWANSQINVIVNDFGGHGTGTAKAGAQYFSRDGVKYEMVTTEPVFTKTVPYDDGTSETFARRERPFVYVNEQGEVLALFTACLPKDGPARVVVQPVDHYYPGRP